LQAQEHLSHNMLDPRRLKPKANHNSNKSL